MSTRSMEPSSRGRLRASPSCTRVDGPRNWSLLLMQFLATRSTAYKNFCKQISCKRSSCFHRIRNRETRSRHHYSIFGEKENQLLHDNLIPNVSLCTVAGPTRCDADDDRQLVDLSAGQTHVPGSPMLAIADHVLVTNATDHSLSGAPMWRASMFGKRLTPLRASIPRT